MQNHTPDQTPYQPPCASALTAPPRPDSFGAILALLARISPRPRYAFMVLQLVAEAADPCGRAGPWIADSGGPVLVRDWLCVQLMPLSGQGGRREALRRRVIAHIRPRLCGDPQRDAALIEEAVADQAQAVGRANVSRAISDLVRAGLLHRFYAGYATHHANRGGGRHAVYALEPGILRLFARAPLLPAAPPRDMARDRASDGAGDGATPKARAVGALRGGQAGRQGELFAA